MVINTGTLRISIGQFKRHLLSKIDEAKNILADNLPDTAEELHDRLDSLTELSQQISGLVDSLKGRDNEWIALMQRLTIAEEMTKEEALYTQTATSADGYQTVIITASTIQSQINTKTRKINRHIASLTAPPVPSPIPQIPPVSQPPPPGGGGASDQPQNGASASNRTTQAMIVKPPKLQLPTFDGDILRWKQFWSVFEKNIHSKAELSGTEKFSYLLPLLKGNARSAIDGLVVDDENYEDAIEILKQQFDRSGDRLVSLLYGELKRMPSSGVKKEDKRKTYNQCEKIFRQLQSAGQDLEANSSLTMDLLSKFPDQMIRDLQRHYKVSFQSRLSEVREAIEKSISELEMTSGLLNDLGSMRPGAERDDRKKFSWKGNERSSGYGRWNGHGGGHGQSQSNYYRDAGPSMSGFAKRAPAGRSFADSQPRSGRTYLAEPPSNCVFCDQRHFNAECPQFSTVGKRIARLLELGRCTRCCQKHKFAGKCVRHVRCRDCRTENDHSTPLCRKPYEDNQKQFFFGKKEPKQEPKPPRKPNDDLSQTAMTSPDAAKTGAKNALFLTAKATIVNPLTSAHHTARLALDTLSNRSYITEKLSQQLGLSIQGSEKLSVSVFGSQKKVDVASHIVQFDIIEVNGNLRTIEANTTRMISNSSVLPESWPPAERELIDTMKHARSLADDPDDSNSSIDILIGADFTWDFIVGPKLQTHTQLMFVPTTLGFMLAGRFDGRIPYPDHTMLVLTETACQMPNEIGLLTQDESSVCHSAYPDIDEYWDLETIGIREDVMTDDDEIALQMFQKSIYRENGRYHVEWPWIKEKQKLLPSNLSVAKRRFNSLSKRLSESPDLLQSYQGILQLQTDRHIIEPVPCDELEVDHTVHYLPHHPVIKPSSNTTKIRIVYDASSKPTKHDVCLNECMLRGPVILPDLCRCLIKFRTHHTVVISDIEKAFLQIGLRPHDRDVTRFFWYKDISKPLTESSNVAVYRFCRVAFGIISSPFLLGATIQFHLNQDESPLAKKLVDDVYVDNIISGLDSSDDVVKYYEEAKEIFNRASMNLFEFCSNSPKLMKRLPQEDRIRQLDARVLGLKWDSQNDDSIRVTKSGKWKTAGNCVTKRDVLKAIASVFDPLGLFQPVMLKAKLLLQDLWKKQVSWDKSIDSNLANQWSEIQNEIEQIFDYRLPRFVGEADKESSLLIFTDASTKAYAMCVYLRVKVNGKWQTNLIYAKSRLAPVARKRARVITLPRLELLGALIGIRAANFCRQAFKFFLPVHLFIDSECVLHWIRSNQELKRFVARRVEEIRSTKECTFHYVRSEDNPADLNTRGKTAMELFDSHLWWHGPPWVREEEVSWKIKSLPPISTETLERISSEVKQKETPVYAFATIEARSESFLGIKAENFSSLSRLIRVTAYCLRMLKRKIWNKIPQQTRDRFTFLKRIFSSVDQGESETYASIKDLWVKRVQNQYFGNSGSTDQRHLMKQLDIRTDNEGLLRSHSRFSLADLPKDTKSPKLLPPKAAFTELVIAEVHRKALHAGTSHTLSQLRKEFWIPKGRATVRKVLNRCILCRKYKTATSFARPEMPPWPVEKVSRSFPFQHVGLDYFGPLNVIVHETRQKMWACLFTCLTTRAVHIEAVTDCSSKEFLNAMTRFISRRGCPETIYSDNAAQFHLVKILVEEGWKYRIVDENITSFLAQKSISWKFIIELAPWQGGHYERLVGVIKSTLKVAIGRRTLSWSDLITLLAEAESVVNSRPITYVPSDRDSSHLTLRPADFITDLPIAIADSSTEVTKPRSDAGKILLSAWKQRQRYLDKLWTHWYDEYLLNLRQTGHAIHQVGRSDRQSSPFIGQVVLLMDENVPRNSWKLVRVEKVIVGDDGLIRGAEVLQPNGVKIKRPVNHLVPLEIETVLPGRDVPASSYSGNRSTTDSDDDDSGFLGFSPADVQRTIDAIRHFDTNTQQTHNTLQIAKMQQSQ